MKKGVKGKGKKRKERGKERRKRVKRISYIALILAILAILALCFYFDKEIVSSISMMQSSFLNQIMLIISYLGIFAVIFIFSTCLVFLHDKKKIKALWLSFAVTAALVFLLKIIVNRARPFTLGLNTLNLLIRSSYTTWDSSFPSSHSAIAFAALPFFKGKLKYYWFVFSCLIAFSRVFFALHYPSDVIAGALIGYAISITFTKIFKLKKGIIK